LITPFQANDIFSTRPPSITQPLTMVQFNSKECVSLLQHGTETSSSSLKERVLESIRETKAMRWLVVKQLPDKVEQHSVSLVRLRLDISLHTPPH